MKKSNGGQNYRRLGWAEKGVITVLGIRARYYKARQASHREEEDIHKRRTPLFLTLSFLDQPLQRNVNVDLIFSRDRVT
jgi:hypothetical protein